MDRLIAAEVFSDVAITQSFTDTAERLAMSRPMVTRYVEAMETWLGARLFNRTTRKVSLTSAGEQYLTEVNTWLEQANAIQSIGENEELRGKIRVAVSMAFGYSQLIPAIKAFLSKHPNVEIDIDSQDKEINLVNDRIDLAIRIAVNPDPSLIGRPIAECESVLVASPDYLCGKPVVTVPNDLAQHQWLGYKVFAPHILHLTQAEVHESVPLKCQFTANEVSMLASATRYGMGITMLPKYMAKHAIEQGDFVQLLPDWELVHMQVWALYPSRKFVAPEVRALIDHLIDFYQENDWQAPYI